MNTKGTTVRKVALMRYGMDEETTMNELNTVWLQTLDLEHLNILAYPTNIMVEDINEPCPLKYVDSEEFFTYKAENGSMWLVSDAIELQDMDAFFKAYLHLDEEMAA